MRLHTPSPLGGAQLTPFRMRPWLVPTARALVQGRVWAQEVENATENVHERSPELPPAPVSECRMPDHTIPRLACSRGENSHTGRKGRVRS